MAVQQPDIEDIPTGIVRCSPDGRILYANDRFLSWMTPLPAKDVIGALFYNVLAPAGRIYFETHIRPMLLLGGRSDEIALQILPAGGTRRQIYLTAKVKNNENGEPEFLDFVCFDGSQRYSYEQELRTQKRKASAFETIFATSPDAMINVDTSGKIQMWNAAAEALFGYSPAEAVGQHIGILNPGAEQDSSAPTLFEKIKTQSPLRIQVTRKHKNGPMIPVELSLARLDDEIGEFAGMAAIVRDMTEQNAADQLIETLNREILHRSKNMLAIVRSIASLTARNSTPADFTKTFSNRLISLSRNMSLLVDRKWADVDIADLIEDQLVPLGELVTDRIHLSGPSVPITATDAEMLSMAIFELSTNAVKYGALSNDAGEIHITWTLHPDKNALGRLEWLETGGPAISQPDSASDGFGSSLTGPLLTARMGGETTHEYPETGFHWSLSLIEDPEL